MNPKSEEETSSEGSGMELPESSTPSANKAVDPHSWSLASFDLSTAKLPLDETWWVPLAEDTLRLAEDVAQHGWLLGSPGKMGSVEQWPGKLWRRCLRYRHFVFFAVVVILVNGLFSFLLLESFLGAARVCAFGQCSSPTLAPTGNLAYDRSNLNMTSPSQAIVPMLLSSDTAASSSAAADAAATAPLEDDDVINELSQEWAVSTPTDVPRVYLLQKRQGDHRALLVQDVCYLYMMGSSADHARPSGVWFDSTVMAAVQEGENEAALRSSRELGRLDLASLLLPPAADGSDSPRDLWNAQRRVNRTVGVFVGPTGLSRYASLGSNTARKALRASAEPERTGLALVGGFESHMNSFSSQGTFLSEVATPPTPSLQTATVFFPSDKAIWSKWTAGAAKAALGGGGAQVVAGKVEGRPTCFQNVLFSLNERLPSAVEADNFRQKAWDLVEATTSVFDQQRAKLPAIRSAYPEALRVVERVLSTSAEGVKHQVALSSDTVSTARFFKEYSESRKRHHITVLIDSVGPSDGPCRRIANIDNIVEQLRRMFPKLAVRTLSVAEAPFIEQVAVLKQTVLLISPHALAMSTFVFLPRGASVIEMFPYMFRSDASSALADVAGVNYFRWENQHAARSKYDDDCFTKGGFEGLTPAECRRRRPCLFCVRDHVSTVADWSEVRVILIRAQRPIRTFLQDRGPQDWTPF